MLYLCRRDEFINDISDDYSAAKNLWFLCLFLCFIFGCLWYFANTQVLLAFNHTFILSSYAHVKRAVKLVNKGLQGVPFVRFFVPVCEQAKRQNKKHLTTGFTAIIHCNSLINFVFSRCFLRQAAVVCCLPFRGWTVR